MQWRLTLAGALQTCITMSSSCWGARAIKGFFFRFFLTIHTRTTASRFRYLKPAGQEQLDRELTAGRPSKSFAVRFRSRCLRSSRRPAGLIIFLVTCGGTGADGRPAGAIFEPPFSTMFRSPLSRWSNPLTAPTAIEHDDSRVTVTFHSFCFRRRRQSLGQSQCTILLHSYLD